MQTSKVTMTKRIGIYIHIPFCVNKCAYCDFYSVAPTGKRMAQYHQALSKQLKEAATVLSGYYIDSIYFGGGTPSFYGARRIADLFGVLKEQYKVLLDAEVTVEINPDSISAKDLRLLRKEGVSRLSIGVQTTDDGLAKSLGRRHSFAQVEKTIARARRAGFENLSVDLIYGLPSQTRKDWTETLNRVIALRPVHISCYGLRVEEGTPLYLFKDSPDIPGEDDQADMYLYLVDALRNVGYRQYEISNFAMPGHESRHNLKYWNREEYIGFGPTAHSYVGDMRYSYIRGVEEYMDALEGKRSILAGQDEISKNEQALEYLMLGLRTTRGIKREEYFGIYQSNFAPIEELLRSYAKHGWAQQIDERWSFTPPGFLLSNRLIREILDVHAKQRVTVGMPWKRGEAITLSKQAERELN